VVWPHPRRPAALPLLCEGSGIRAIQRVVGCHQGTILKLLVEVGAGCEQLLSETVKNVAVEDVQADEVWGYVHCKEGTCCRLCKPAAIR